MITAGMREESRSGMGAARQRADQGAGNDRAPLPAADRRLIELIRQGDRDAGHELVRTYYPGVHRYLLYLTGRAELAEDLTQETFVQAWSHLDTFEGRSPLRPWLHRIAHREFLQFLRRRRDESSLEEAGDLPDADAHEWTEPVELRALLRELPLEQRQMIILHYVEGYHVDEIARILGVPLGRVKFRLVEARGRLRSVMGEGDLVYLNQVPGDALRRWSWLPLEEMTAMEARLQRPGPPSHDPTGLAAAQTGGPGEPRPAGGATPDVPREEEVIDDRLNRKVTLAVRGMALVDLCDCLRTDAGVHLAANASVADEKVSLFCRDLPLRDVMRQLSRPFGYTWLRTGNSGAYRYELVQDLRSQLMEEELANRDRNTALVVLERELERYRLYLDLSPDEAQARAKTAPAEEKALLQKLGGSAWGAVQMFFSLTPQQMTRLRAGDELKFSQEARPGEPELPADIARGVLQSLRDVYYHRHPDGFGIVTGVKEPDPAALRPTAVPEARAHITLRLKQTEPGRVALTYAAGTFSHSDLQRNSSGSTWEGDGAVAAGASPAVLKLDNRAANARLSREPTMRRGVTVEVVPGCRPVPAGSPSLVAEATADAPRAVGPRATTADALEAIHRATGLPVVGDFFTRLYSPSALSLRGQPLFDTLNQIADATNLRWNKDGDWLQFRSASYFHDRAKEVPNRLLTRWQASRQKNGALTLEELVEIARLTDAQLDAVAMAEGAEQCWGLREWILPRAGALRRDLCFLAELSPAQREEASGPTGLAFAKLSLAQQQRFIEIGMRFDEKPLQTLDELEGAVVRVEYTQPGGYVWIPPGSNWFRWVVPLVPGPEGRRAVLPACRGRTPAEARAAARRLDARLLEAILPEARRLRPEMKTADMVVDAGEVVPTGLDLTVAFIPGLSNRHTIHIASLTADYHNSTW